MTITKQRVEEIISRIEMYGHGAGYTADEVYDLAVLALNLSNIANLKRYEINPGGFDPFSPNCYADMSEGPEGEFVMFDDVVNMFKFDTTAQQFESLSNHKYHFINGTCDNSRSSATAGGRMSRMNVRKPPKYMPAMNSAKPVKLTYGQIKELPLMSDVYVMMNDGKILNGKLVSHSDYLVGCPVVDIGEYRSIGIGYEGEIVAAAPKQEDL